MDTELQELWDLVQQLRTDHQRLLEAHTASIRTDSSNLIPDIPRSHDHFVYVPKESKSPVFRGTVGIGIAE